MFAAHNGFLTGSVAKSVTYKSATGGRGQSYTIPAHAVGDIIVVFATTVEYDYKPSVPTASGTVPTWTVIGSPTDATRSVLAYTIAAATNTTSGTWSGAEVMFIYVLSGQGSAPIGGYAYTSGSGSTAATAPAITLSDSSGSSQILHFATTNTRLNTRSTLTGYTQRVDGTSSFHDYRSVTKNITTTDGSVSMFSTYGANGTSASLEIRA